MEFRSLRSEEMEAWLDHVTAVFRASRQYFMNHWQNDPWQDFEGIRVAIDDGKIVSTVRVFIRQMYLHGTPISVGGIGEVSTLPEYQRRGLATRLLQDSIRFMEGREIAMSSLHGSRAIYPRQGWNPIPRYYARAQMPATRTEAFHIRPADFDAAEERAQLSSLYKTYSRRFNGTFVRNHAKYWSDWIPTESRHAWVAEANGVIKGYISTSKDEDQLRIREFLASEDGFSQDRGQAVFEALVGAIIDQMDIEDFNVVYPAPIADGFYAETIEENRGAMYRVITPSKMPQDFDSLEELLHQQPEAWNQGLKSHHIFWGTDGY